jgi:outer membrane protein assembly factor BamB
MGPVAGAAVHLPGLPKVAVLTEDRHHLTAVDLASGEPRWRWSWSTGRGATAGSGIPRLKRAGRLLYFVCGDSALTAIDVISGVVVWRLRDRLRFRTPPVAAREAIYAVSGGAHGAARLYSIDPFSGVVLWSSSVSGASAPCTVEGAPLVAARSVAVAVRHKSGLALTIFKRSDGAPIEARGIAGKALTSNGTSWLAIDDAFIGNSASGEVVAIDATEGDLRWRHVLGPRPLDADVPRRLEPVLRCGALFIPCSMVCPTKDGALERPHETTSGVAILRPSDGRLIGSISPTDAIPDLLRVDEFCDIYVAEESGHLAAYKALPRLSLVPRPVSA